MIFDEYSLEDILEFKYGKNQKKVEDENGQYPILGTGGVMGFANDYLYDKPSVLIGRKGSINKVRYMDSPFWTVDTLFYTKINEDIVFPKYLYYCLSLIDFNHYNEGTTIPSLRTQTLKKIKVLLPKKKEQLKILRMIDPLYKKIKLNNNIIDNLEETAKTLFKRWFVDFEFPDEDGKPYKSNGKKMVESGLGMIPEGWIAGKLNNIGKIVGGGTPSKKKKEYYTEKGYGWITPKDLSVNKSIYIYKGAMDITEEAIEKSSAKLHPKDTVLFSSRAPIGYIAIAAQQVSTNQGFKSIIPNEGFSSIYIYFLLKHLTPRIKLNAGGSTFKEISGKAMKDIETIIPTDPILSLFYNVTKSFFDNIKYKENENKMLEELRGNLLSKLIAGEIELPDDTEVNEDVPVPGS